MDTSATQTASRHWQDDQAGRLEEKQRRTEEWKDEMVFPPRFVPEPGTIDLFKDWAREIHDYKLVPLINKCADSEIELEILDRIKHSFAESVEAFPYGCITRIMYAIPRIKPHPYYPDVFQRVSSFKDRISNGVRYIDVGCCMGTDLRYVCLDQKDIIKKNCVLGIDIQKEFLDTGCNILYKDGTTKDSVTEMRSRFVQANILDDDYVAMSSNPKLLKEFGGKTDIVYCGSVFHLMSEKQTQKASSVIFNDFLFCDFLSIEFKLFL